MEGNGAVVMKKINMMTERQLDWRGDKIKHEKKHGNGLDMIWI